MIKDITFVTSALIFLACLISFPIVTIAMIWTDDKEILLKIWMTLFSVAALSFLIANICHDDNNV